VLGICPSGNNRDDDITIVSPDIYFEFDEYPL